MNLPKDAEEARAMSEDDWKAFVEWATHRVFQIGPEFGNAYFRYALMVATEVKYWGIQGYCHSLEHGGQAYIRVTWPDLLELVDGGKAQFV